MISSMFKHRVADFGDELDDEINDTFWVSISWPNDAEGQRTQALFADWISWFLGYAAVI